MQSGADAFLADESPSYQAASAYSWRGMVRVARGDVDGAQDDAERALELARRAKDPQVILSVLAEAAMIFLSAGNEARAGETLDEILAEVRRLRRWGSAPPGHTGGCGSRECSTGWRRLSMRSGTSRCSRRGSMPRKPSPPATLARRPT